MADLQKAFTAAGAKNARTVIASGNVIFDAPAALGFTVYSVIMVLLLTFLLDVLQALFDPRVREGILHS